MSRTPLTVNGRTYRWPDRPLVVVCVDGCEPDYINQAIEAGSAPWMASLERPRHLPDRRLRRAVVHQPEQPVDRHGRAAVRARHLRQLLLGPGRRRRSDDERRQVPAHRHDPRGVRRRRRQGRRHHRQGQAALAARPQAQGDLLLGGEGRPGHRSPPTASPTRCRWPACRCRRSTARRCRSSCSPRARRCSSATRPTSCTCRRPTTSSTSTRPARPRRTSSPAMIDRYLGRMDALGATRRVHRRPRDERQDRCVRPSQHRVPAGPARRAGSAPASRA